MTLTFQPDPILNDTRPVWEQVIEDYKVISFPELKDALGKDIVAIMKERNEFGIKRYSIPLQINNGRNAIHDLLEELLDSCAYTKQAILEGLDDNQVLTNIYISQLMNLEVLVSYINKMTRVTI